ncbi:MAG: YajQ family cyclic di-GMP-binding protein [Deltaproteobacteria bacterium]|nr:YajQ family cyclic di-GMP-binding protein [Deltaproteobacteria bacterium]
MPSFDIVNKVDMQEIDNAVNNCIKEVATRFDFRNSRTAIELNKKDKVINIVTSDKMKMEALQDMITTHCIRRKVNSKCLEFKDFEPTGQGLLKREVKIKEGIEMEIAHKIVKIIKGLNLKVQASIQDEQVRVSGKKIDDLQAVIQTLNAQDLGIPLQYVNMKA